MISKFKKQKKNNSIEKFRLWRWQFNYRFVPDLAIGLRGRHDLGDVHVISKLEKKKSDRTIWNVEVAIQLQISTRSSYRLR